MPVSTQTYRILIASPSDLTEERDAAEAAVHDWNAQHAVAQGITLLPIRWETHAYPQSNVRPQEALNRQLVKSSDILIGMFWTKLGTNTGVAESGTVEEIDEFDAADKPVMLYFSDRPIAPAKLDAAQLEKLKAFKTEKYKNALVGKFASLDDLRSRLIRDLTHLIHDIKTKKIQAQEQTAAFEQRWQVAAKTRADFEHTVKIEKFHNFKAQPGIMALTIVPVVEPDDHVRYKGAQMVTWSSRFKPIGSTECVYCQQIPGARLFITVTDMPIALTEVRENGNVKAVRNMVYMDGTINVGNLWPVNMAIEQPALIRAIVNYLTGLKELDVTGQWLIGISLCKMHNALLMPGEYNERSAKFARAEARPMRVDEIITDLIDIPADANVTDFDEIQTLLEIPLRYIWQHCGYTGYPHFKERGFEWRE